jgi:hypothetical protein
MTKISNQYSLTNILTADLANSRLGINNVSPTVALDVTGAGRFSSSVTATNFIATGGNNVVLLNSANATTGWQQIAMANTSGSTLLGVEGSTAGTLATGSLAYASVLRNYTNTALQFGTNNIVRATITSAGNVGIGTTTPAQKLTVSDNSANDLILQVRNLTSGYGTNLFLQGNDNSGAAYNSVISFTFGGTRHWGIGGGGSVGTFVIDTNGSERMRITSGGDVLISNTDGNGKLVIGGDDNNYILRSRNLSAGGNYQFYIQHSLANVSMGNQRGTVAYNNSSDYRLKEDLKEFNGLDILSSINFYDFKWKQNQIRNYGVIAHELQEILPYVVEGKKDELFEDGSVKSQQVDITKLVPILGKAIQELSAKVSLLENK